MYSTAAGKTCFAVTLTTWSPTVSAWSIQTELLGTDTRVSGAEMVLKVYATSAAVSGSPLWNFTPGRSSNSSVVSSSHFQDCASSGFSCSVSGSRCSRVSNAWCATISPVRALLK